MKMANQPANIFRSTAANPGADLVRNSLVILVFLALMASQIARAQETLVDGWNAAVAGNCSKALQIIEPAARQNSAGGIKLVGDMYFYGKCKPSDRAKGFSLYLQAAKLGLAIAQYNVGYAYDHGDEVAPNAAEAASWYRQAADQGYIKAQSNLAVLYLSGKGVAKDVARGAAMTESAALRGYAPAQANLGRIYREGIGRPIDLKKALYWQRSAAVQGDAGGLAAFGTMHEIGWGTPKNAGIAYLCYLLAAQRGNENAFEDIRRIRPKLSDHQVSLAIAFAKKWKPGQKLPLKLDN